MKIITKLTSWYFSKNALPYWCVLALDSLILVMSGLFAMCLCDGAMELVQHFWYHVFGVCVSLPFFFIGMRLFHTYAGIFRYSSFVDLMRASCAILVGIALSACLYSLAPAEWILVHSWSRVLFLGGFISMLIMWSVRIMVKYLYDTAVKDNAQHRVYIYGVRTGGISLAKSMRNEHPLSYLLKGFMTDEEDMIGKYLLGVDVCRAVPETIEKMKKDGADMLFVSPTSSERFRENDLLVNQLTKAGIKIMMLPSAEKWDGKSDISHSSLREVDIEDLLPREKIEVDLDAIGCLLKDRRILITGAAGSIGGEMVRQVAKFSPRELVLVDQAETPMHDVRLFMSRNFGHIRCLTVVGSISNATHMEQIFKDHRPEYVFHAAAYKHVPMMEDNPAMAVQNNTYGTRVIADLAVKYGTKKFVMISTDKAVNPTNVMGCSKRICEIYCQALNQEIVKGASAKNPILQEDGSPAVTQFITTRFGNVLGSNGSVIPIFREQIRKGGPVTVTHPDIIRYFMLIPEACQLVLEAGTMGHGGEIFVFDMGKPVRIADLAQRMIDLSGAKDIGIKFTGLRDGEKLYEEVLNDAELTKPTMHPKIKVASVREYPYDQARANEEELYRLSFSYDDMQIVAKMKEIVPEYRSQHSKYEILDR